MTLSPTNWYRFRQLDRDRIELGAPAKINLFLKIPGKRPDGYHFIQSLMQTVDWFDTITISKSDEPECALMVITDGPPLGAGSDNLVQKSYDALKEKFAELPGVEITLKKSIPMEAGLGGGSSDAAATLFGLNVLFQLGLSDQELAEIGATIGSDIPFFFSTGSALVSGRGEIFESTPLPHDYWVVIAKPTVGLSTAEAFRALGRQLTVSPEMTTLPDLTNSESLIEWLSLLDNDFEEWALERLPVLESVRKRLRLSGAQLVRLSGSGSAMFGLFRERPNDQWLFGESKDTALIGVQTQLCRPIQR